MSAPAFVALGSNLGDRDGYLAHARACIVEWPGTTLVAESTIEETAPIGPDGQGHYLNQMLLIQTDLSPDEVLRRAHAVEDAAGRKRDRRWGARTLDIDLVWFADQEISTDGLTLPHPELPNRGFWVREMAELYPRLEVQWAGAELPAWARVGEARFRHIERVVGLIGAWGIARRVAPVERARWVRAAYLHDALRDVDPEELAGLARDPLCIAALRHGPAAAAVAEEHGETDVEVLQAVRYHSVGWAGWREVGRMLYMADYLEPGRPFDRGRRAELAQRVLHDPDAVLLEVTRDRLIRALRRDATLPVEGIDFWNAIVDQR